MLIKDIALRQKESHLFKNLEENMSLEIKNISPKINDEKEGIIQIFKRLIVEIKKNDDVLANFIIGVQCSIELQCNEDFDIIKFDNLLFPFFYSNLNQMFGEMNLPTFPISTLYNKS